MRLCNGSKRFCPATQVLWRGNAQRVGIGHDFLDDARGFLDLLPGALEHKFIMDLQQHPGFQAGRFQCRSNLQHGELHNVRRGALDRCVDSFTFFAILDLHIGFALQGREVAPASEQRLDIALLRGQFANAVQVFFDTGKFFEIRFDDVSAWRVNYIVRLI
jgi:hypothetical protein